MTPDAAREWVKILRDIATVAIAAFILVHETVSSPNPNWELIGAGLTLLGVPPALRADELRRRKRDAEED